MKKEAEGADLKDLVSDCYTLQEKLEVRLEELAKGAAKSSEFDDRFLQNDNYMTVIKALGQVSLEGRVEH